MPRKKFDKKKSASLKKANRRKKPIQREKPTHPKVPSGNLSAQIHQGVGLEDGSQSKPARRFPEDDAEYGEES
jgi:hypothetical protein